jgi:hypothetical protein
MIALPPAAGTWALVLAIVFVLGLLLYEWKGLQDNQKIETMSLAHIERSHPRLLTVREMVIAIILSTTLGILVAELALLL